MQVLSQLAGIMNGESFVELRLKIQTVKYSLFISYYWLHVGEVWKCFTLKKHVFVIVLKTRVCYCAN